MGDWSGVIGRDIIAPRRSKCSPFIDRGAPLGVKLYFGAGPVAPKFAMCVQGVPDKVTEAVVLAAGGVQR